jgi:hypothetical protein
MAEPKKEKKPKKPVRTPALQELAPRAPRAPGALAGSAAGAVAAEAAGSGLGSAIGAEATDPFLSRNEFKEGFYSQPSQPATTAETMYGKGTKRGFEYPTVDPDTKMMQDAQGMAEGGSVRGQKNIQVKKKPFRGIF